MVDQPVDDGSSHVVVPEHRSPAGELQIGGDDHAALFIAVGDDLEQQRRTLGVDREVTQLVDLCGYAYRSTYAQPVTMPSHGRRGQQKRGHRWVPRRNRLLRYRHSYRALRVSW